MTPERDLLLYLLEYAADELERQARTHDHFHKNADALEAWAARIRSNFAPNSVCLASENAKSTAREIRRVLDALKHPTGPTVAA